MINKRMKNNVFFGILTGCVIAIAVVGFNIYKYQNNYITNGVYEINKDYIRINQGGLNKNSKLNIYITLDSAKSYDLWRAFKKADMLCSVRWKHLLINDKWMEMGKDFYIAKDLEDTQVVDNVFKKYIKNKDENRLNNSSVYKDVFENNITWSEYERRKNSVEFLKELVQIDNEMPDYVNRIPSITIDGIYMLSPLITSSPVEVITLFKKVTGYEKIPCSK